MSWWPKAIFGLLCMLAVSMTFTSPSHALGLKVAPLEYRTSLKKDEIKKGFIDASNPSDEAINVTISVQSFRQIDNNGGLQFYDDKTTSAGITPEIPSVELGPKQALRLYFTINSALLPKGDNYAAIFFTTEPKQAQGGVGQLIKVGTLLSIVNEDPGPRQAKITGLSLPFVQLGDVVHGVYTVKNIGSGQSGFFPEVTVSAWPAEKPKQIASSLVFGGRERNNDFNYHAGYGIHHVSVGFGASKKGQWVVTIAPWMLVVLGVISLIIFVEVSLLKKRRQKRSISA